MGRREQREQIFKLLFRVEFNTIEEMPEQCRLFFEDEENTASAGDEEYIREKFRGKEFTYDKTVMNDGSIVFEIMTAGIHQRYTFTEI